MQEISTPSIAFIIQVLLSTAVLARQFRPARQDITAEQVPVTKLSGLILLARPPVIKKLFKFKFEN